MLTTGALGGREIIPILWRTVSRSKREREKAEKLKLETQQAAEKAKLEAEQAERAERRKLAHEEATGRHAIVQTAVEALQDELSVAREEIMQLKTENAQLTRENHTLQGFLSQVQTGVDATLAEYRTKTEHMMRALEKQVLDAQATAEEARRDVGELRRMRVRPDTR